MYRSKFFKLSILFLAVVLLASLSLFGCKEEAVETEAEEVEEVAEEEEATEEVAEVELSKEPVTLNIILEQSSGAINEAHNAIFDEFMELYPNVTINAQVYEETELGIKIRNAITIGGPLDGYMTSCFDAAWFSENEAAAEIDPSIFGKTLDEYVNEWLPGSFETCGAKYKGKYIGIPFNVANYVGFINLNSFKNAGLDPEKDIPETWAEAREIGKKMTIVEGGVTVQDGFYQFLGKDDKYILSSLFQQKGLDWQSLEGMIAGCDTPEAVEALKMYTDVVTVDKSMDPATFEPLYSPLADGTAAMWFWGGPWIYGLIEAGGGNPDDYMAIKYPRFADGLDKSGMSYGYGLFIAQISENKDWTLKLFDYWTSKPELYAETDYYLPRADFDTSILADSIKGWSVFEEELPKATPYIIDSRFEGISDAVLKAEERVVYEGYTAEEAIAMLKTDLEALQ